MRGARALGTPSAPDHKRRDELHHGYSDTYPKTLRCVVTDVTDWNERERAARIDQMLADNDRSRAETRKFLAETDKLLAESRKLLAEAHKYRWIDPLLALATLIAALGISRFFGH